LPLHLSRGLPLSRRQAAGLLELLTSMRTRCGSASPLFLAFMVPYFSVELATGAVRNDARFLRFGAYLIRACEIGHEYWRLITSVSHWDPRSRTLPRCLAASYWDRSRARRAVPRGSCSCFLTAYASGRRYSLKHQLWPSQGVSLGASGGLFGLFFRGRARARFGSLTN